jgi:hypothetical protein
MVYIGGAHWGGDTKEEGYLEIVTQQMIQMKRKKKLYNLTINTL